MMDAPLDAGQDAAAAEPTEAEPGPEAVHDCWSVVLSDLDRAVAPIRRDARRHHLPPSEIDEVVQDAVCQAWSKRDEHDPTRPLIPWLRGFGRRAIMARLLAMSLADAATDGAEDFSAVHERREHSPDAVAEVSETRGRLKSLLDRAPSRYREVLVARYWEGLRISAVAARLGQTSKAVERCLARALVWLEEGWRGARNPDGSGAPQEENPESEGEKARPFG